MRDELPGDEEVKAMVVPATGRSVGPKDLVAFLEPRLPAFMVSPYIEVVDALLLRTETAKVRKIELRTIGVNDRTSDRLASVHRRRG